MQGFAVSTVCSQKVSTLMNDAPSAQTPPHDPTQTPSPAAHPLSTASTPITVQHDRAWPALWSIVIGFFMILVDSTIVTVALNPIMEALKIDSFSTVLWVTSAYLLAYAVPLLISGRLGDRFGPKNLYLIGLVVFTLSSLGCGLSTTITALITWRVVQGLGAGLMTPQTMAVITRLFPPASRGAAMGIWGAVAGFATLVGPIAGGLLTDSWGWEWIFFVNIPVGIIAVILVAKFVPRLPKAQHSFDWFGVLLSAVAMFLIVFGIQESGETGSAALFSTGVALGLVALGVIVLIGFVLWQHHLGEHALMPLALFKDRNFSVANIAISAVGAFITAFAIPIVTYLQRVHNLSPTDAALVLVPMAIVTLIASPLAGRYLLRAVDPRTVAIIGLAINFVALCWSAVIVFENTNYLLLIIPTSFMGIGSACMWAPISMLATVNLPPKRAGAGSSVYNTTRQVGSVIGSAILAAVMSTRISANISAALPRNAHVPSGSLDTATLPPMLHEPFAHAMADATWVSIIAAAVGLVVVFFFTRTRASNR